VISADFFTKHLSINRREGAAHVAQHLVDGIFADNDADGAYARRHVRELGTPDHRLRPA
jgi:deoxyribodipyrimidine photolyase